MDRSSSRRDLRAERISNSPYARPEKKRTGDSALKSFPSFSSLVSLVASPFRRSAAPALPTHSAGRIADADDRADDIETDGPEPSVSGSEDEWNGEPPDTMAGQDVFSLAAAAGRDGDDFERRAAVYRARGEIVGGRRDLARRGLAASASSFGLAPASSGIRPSPSMPVLPVAPIAPVASVAPVAPAAPVTAAAPFAASRVATPRLHTPRPRAGPPSASAAALTSFMEAKAGAPMTADDLRVLDTLTQSIHAEVEAAAASTPVRAAPATASSSRAGWSAGSYSTPRAGSSTPARSATPIAPSSGGAFSLGTAPPTPTSTPKRVYLGPGMSPRRVQPKQRSGLRSLFTFDLEPREASALKKRRTDEFVETEPAPPVPPIPAAHAAPSPRLTTTHASASTPARPSPLGQSTTASSPTPRDEIVRRAKRNAADIMREVIDAEIGPLDRPPQPIVFNPYEADAPRASPPPASPSAAASASTPVARSGTPRRPTTSLRASVRASTTPSRGAAERIERFKGERAQSTMERVAGFQPERVPAALPASSSARAVRVETPEKERDMMDVDALVDGALNAPPPPAPRHAPPPTRAAPPPAKPALKLPQPEVFAPFAVPAFGSSSMSTPAPPRPAPAPAPVHEPSAAFAFDAIVKPAAVAPTFTPSPVTLPRPDNDEAAAPPASSAPVSSPAPAPRADKDAVFLSARDAALSVARPALPFFTFDVPPRRSAAPADDVKAAALAGPPTTDVFSFTFKFGEAGRGVAPAPAAPQAAGPWTCGLCMLQNPASAADSCTICEAPRPAAAPATTPVPAAVPATTAPAATAAQWTCDMCMLKNPDGAREKCTICEAPRPARTLAAPPAAPAAAAPAGAAAPAPTPAPTPFVMPGFSAPTPAAGTWTCATCMCTSPAGAEKCVVCETPR